MVRKSDLKRLESNATNSDATFITILVCLFSCFISAMGQFNTRSCNLIFRLMYSIFFYVCHVNGILCNDRGKITVFRSIHLLCMLHFLFSFILVFTFYLAELKIIIITFLCMFPNGLHAFYDIIMYTHNVHAYGNLKHVTHHQTNGTKLHLPPPSPPSKQKSNNNAIVMRNASTKIENV